MPEENFGTMKTISGIPQLNLAEVKVKDVADTSLPEDKATMSQNEFFGIVDNAIASGNFQGQSQEQVYNGMLESVTQDGIIIEGITPTKAEVVEEIVEEPIEEEESKDGEFLGFDGKFDTGKKFGEGISKVGKFFRFQSNVDDGVIESGLKFLGNLPGNTVQIGGDLISVVSDPIGTAKGVKDVAGATVEKLTNESLRTEPVQALLRKAGVPEDKLQSIKEGESYFSTPERELMAEGLTTEFKKLGEPGRIKELLTENPADVLLTVVGGLGTAKNLAKSKNLIGLANKIEKVQKVLNPIEIQAKALRTAKKGVTGTKSKLFPTKSLDDIALQVTQGGIDDLPAFKSTIDKISTKGIKNYKDLSGSFTEKIKDLSKLLDTKLSKKADIDVNNLVTQGKEGITSKNFVKQSMDDLFELYETIDDLDGQERILELQTRPKISQTDINNLAKEYNVEFGKKAFSKRTGDPLTSVNAQRFETTRKGVKNALRELLPDDTAKVIDSELSNLYSSRMLTDKMASNVVNLTKKLEKRGLLENVGRGIAKVADIATFGSVRGFLTSFLPSNVGNKVMNALDIESNLASNLKKLEKLNSASKLDDATFAQEAAKILQDLVGNQAGKVELGSQLGKIEE